MRNEKVGAGIEGRIDVDEIDLAHEIFQQTAQDKLVVTPNELVVVGLLAPQFAGARRSPAHAWRVTR